MDVFTKLFAAADNILNNYAYTAAESMIEWVTPIFTSLMIVWIAIWGYQLMLGRAHEPMQDGAIRIITVGLIMSVGLTISTYSSLIVDLMSNGPAEIAGVISGSSSASIGGVIDSLYEKVDEISDAAFEEAGVMSGDFGMYFIGAGVWAVGAIMCLIVALMVIIAKVATAVLLAIGPLAFALLLFSPTKGIFQGWVTMLVNQGFILILGTAVGVLMIKVAEGFVTQLTASGVEDAANRADIGVLAIVFLAAIYIMKQVPTLAQGLSPSVELVTNGLSRAVGQPLGRLGGRATRATGRATGRAAKATGQATAQGAKRGYSAAKRAFSNRNSIRGQ